MDSGTATAMVVAELFSREPDVVQYQRQERDETYLFCLRDAVNGSMVRGVIDLARQAALSRDLQTGDLTGVTMEDFGRAVEQVYKQQQTLEHQFDVEYFLDLHNLPRCECNVEKCRSDD